MKQIERDVNHMRRFSFLGFCCGFFISTRALAISGPVSLDDVYRASLSRNEDVATQGELVNQTHEKYNQAKAALFPTITGIITESTQAVPSDGLGSALYPTNQQTIKVTAVQPIYHHQLWAGLRQQTGLNEAAQASKVQAMAQLFSDVTDAYFQTLLAMGDIVDLNKELDDNQKRREELIRFRRLGRSRDTDVLTMDASISTLLAQIEAAKTAEQNARTAFALLTGLPADSTLIDRELYPDVIPTFDVFKAKVETRPDVLALKKNVDANDEAITIARSGHIPYLDLTADYFFARPGSLSNINWDAGLTLTIPIFQGGTVLSQVRQAASVMKQSELALQKGLRTARLQVEQFYHSVMGDRAQIEKQKAALDASNKTYQAEIRDYRLGVVNNLEVLQSLTSAESAQISYDHAVIQFKTDYMKLLAATGERPNSIHQEVHQDPQP